MLEDEIKAQFDKKYQVNLDIGEEDFINDNSENEAKKK